MNLGEMIPHWLSKRAQLSPQKIAIEAESGESITFFELEKRSKCFAEKLASLDIEKGSCVGILSTNEISMVVAIHAISYLGAIAVLLNTRLTEEELIYQVTDAEVSLILTCDDYVSHAQQMDFHVPVRSFSEVNQLLKQQVQLHQEINLEADFTIIYTSGTTGFPKGVVHTYGNHWSSAVGSALNLGLHENDKWLAMLPIFHVSGLSIFMKSVIYGMPVLLFKKFQVEKVNQAIIEQGVTIVSVVTVMLQRLIDSLGSGRYPTSLRCMLLGGGPVPKPLLEKAKDHQVPVFQSYGMTETSSQIVTLSPSDAFRKIGSAGKPLFTAQLKIIDPDVDGVGEIYVKGPMVTKEYFNNRSATEAAFRDHWLATGDLGYVDEEGFLYVMDRRSDLIISGGENVYPAEVEAVLTGMDHIQEVGVVGVDDDAWGQVPVAFVVKTKASVTANEMIDYAQQRLAKYKVPKRIYFVPQLPRNASNKLMRRELLKWLSFDDLRRC